MFIKDGWQLDLLLLDSIVRRGWWFGSSIVFQDDTMVMSLYWRKCLLLLLLWTRDDEGHRTMTFAELPHHPPLLIMLTVRLITACWLVGWLGGWLIGWLVGWLGGWLVGWVGGWLVGWLGGWLIGWLVGWLVGWVVDWLVGWLVDWLVGWLGGWLVGWLAGWLVGWLGGWLTGWLTGRNLIDWLTNIVCPFAATTTVITLASSAGLFSYGHMQPLFPRATCKGLGQDGRQIQNGTIEFGGHLTPAPWKWPQFDTSLYIVQWVGHCFGKYIVH